MPKLHQSLIIHAINFFGSPSRGSGKALKNNLRYPSYFIIIFLPALLLTACYHENRDIVPAPVKTISKDSMVKIVTDMQIIEGVVSYQRLNRVNNHDLKDNYYDKMLHHYGITAKQLQDNLNFYNAHPDVMGKIYNKVIENLTLENAKIESIHDKREKARMEREKRRNFPPAPTWVSPLSDTLFNSTSKISAWMVIK